MATRYCHFVSGAGKPCYKVAELNSGQRRFCTRHHRTIYNNDAAYKARATAYDTDPALVAATAAYEKALQEARQEAQRVATEAASKLVPVEIPMEVRTRIKISGGPSWHPNEEDISALCVPYGRVGRISIACDKDGKKSGVVYVTFATHPEAADTLSNLDGMPYDSTTLKAEWITTVTPTPAYTPCVSVYGVTPPTVRLAKRHLDEVRIASRERANPGILAAEAEEDAAERAEREAEEADEYQQMRAEDDYREMEAREAERSHKYAMYQKEQRRRSEDDYYGDW